MTRRTAVAPAPLLVRPVLDEYVLLPELVGFGVVAIVVVVATRGRLSYHPTRPERPVDVPNPPDFPG